MLTSISTKHELKLTIGPHGHTSQIKVHDVFSPSLTLDTELIVLESVLLDSHSEWFDVIQIHKAEENKTNTN